MSFINHFFEKEISHFKKLSAHAQKLLYSIFLFNLIGPIIGIFINAFLWRQTQDFMIIGLYNLLIFAAVPLGFYLNGILLKYYPTNVLYTISLLIRVLLISTLIFLPQITYTIITIFGLCEGIVAGIYWANRNLLTLKTTHSNDRIYFSSLESVSDTTSDIAVPVVIGWFITFGSVIHLYTAHAGYKMLSIVLLLATGLFGWLMTNFRMELKPISNLFVTNAGKSWNKFRLLQFVLGFSDGVRSFAPALMILLLVGDEGTLGLVQSLAAALSAFVVYILGKSLKIKHRLVLLQISFTFALLGAIFFSVTYSALGVIIFFAFQAISSPFSWVAIQSLNYDLIDEENKKTDNGYAYVCDQEIYLNGGRVIAVAGFLWLVYAFSNDTALRFTPLIFASAQIFLLFLAKSIEKKPNSN